MFHTVAAAPVPPIAAHDLLVLLLQLGVLLGVALVLGRLAARFGMPALVGELLAGVLLGPSLLAQVSPELSAWLLPSEPGQQHMLDAVGQLGVLLLVGITGMHIDLNLIRRNGLVAAGVSTTGVLVPLGLGIATGLLLPASFINGDADRPVFALFVGVALCVSALPVIAKILFEMRLLHRDIGQLTLTAAAIDDIVGWMLLSVVSAMATHGLQGKELLVPIAGLAGVLASVVLVGRPVVRAVMRLSTRRGEPGVSVAVAVVMLLLFGAGTQALGMEPILGTFLGGILIGSSGRSNLEWLAPLRTFVMAVLAPIFFASAGLRMNLTALGRPVILLSAIAVLVVAIAGKFIGAYLGARMTRLGHWEGVALGASLNARGVIEVIIAMVGLRLGILGTEAYTVIVLVAVVTSLMAPPMLRIATRRIQTTLDERRRERILSPGRDAHESEDAHR
jgi:Kef-type K+ transport system membrane component KefB